MTATTKCKDDGSVEVLPGTADPDNLDGKITLMLKGGAVEAMRFEANGDIFVRGELVETNIEVLAGFKNWLRKACAAQEETPLMPKVEHKVWLRRDWMQELKEGSRVRVPFCNSARRPKTGDVLKARAHDEGDSDAIRVTVVSVERDDATTTTLKRTD